MRFASDLGLRVQALRIKRGISKAALARAIGVSTTAIIKLESGETQMVRADHLLLMAAELGANPVALVFGEHSQQYQRVIARWPDTDAARTADLQVKFYRLLSVMVAAFNEELERLTGQAL